MHTAGGCLTVSGDENVVVFYNLVTHCRARGNVLIVSPFGKSAKDMFIFAYYLWRAGYNVYRFDARNHVGFGSGVIENYTLSAVLKDLRLVHGTIANAGVENLILVGISLSVPIVLKFVAEEAQGVSSVISVVGAVDVTYAIEQATGHSVMPYRNKLDGRAEFQTILGYDVRAQDFVDDMDRCNFATLEDVVELTRKIQCPVHTIMAAEDAWVLPESLMRCHEAASAGSSLACFEGVTHEFGRSASMAKRISLEICRLCDLSAPKPIDPAGSVPNFAEILQANAVESNSLAVLVETPLAISLVDVELADETSY